MDNAHKEFKYVETDVVQEKAKLNAEVDSIKLRLNQLIEDKRAELNAVFDIYL